jgi:hypothetical protein
MTTTSPFRNFGVSEDQRFAELLRALEAQSFDGTEINGIVRKELNRFGLGRATNTIMRAIEQKYGGTIRIDVMIEIIGKWLEDEGHI